MEEQENTDSVAESTASLPSDADWSTAQSFAGWRPIESAPRDGMHILAAKFGATAGIGFGYCGLRGESGIRALQPWADVVHWFPGEGDAVGVGGFYSSNWGGDQAEPYEGLTHWTPLPAPPTDPTPDTGEQP